MSLYNLVTVANPAARMLFLTIDLDLAKVPRLRDIWIDSGLTEVTVFTRTGGGNREEYADENAALRAHPGFLRDTDWAVDVTYALFVFAVPPEKAAAIRSDIAARDADEQEKIYVVLTLDADTKWQAVMDNLAAERG